jgi:hypothetical protein
MNERIRSHFDEIETRLIECPVILSYQITRRDISPDDGKLRPSCFQKIKYKFLKAYLVLCPVNQHLKV